MVRRLGTLVLLGGALLALPSPAHGAARLDADLRGDLARSVSGPITLFVHGTSVARVKRAGDRHGFKALGQWPAIDTVMLRGPRRGVVRLRRERGLRFIEGDRRFIPLSGTATQASRAVNLGSYTDPSGLAVDGRGVSAAIVDTGVDGTHPFFSNDGRSRVVRNLKVACFGVTLPSDLCYVDSGPANDTDTASTGGHGTHVAGIVAGRPVTTTLFNLPVRGTAPGASLVSISGGQLISMALNLSAQEWVLKHHAAPCGAAASAAACPPIRVVNHSWGPSGGGTFAEGSATVRIQRELLKAGIVTVWAAGNDGGDATKIVTNPPGQDPTPGVLMVANYDDADTGTRDGKLSNSSSRGQKGVLSSYPDVAAPGTNITSSCRPWLAICSAEDNGPGALDLLTFGTISGTSMAAPHVTGIVAALFQAVPQASPAQVEAAIIDTAHRFTAGLPYEADPRGGQTSPDKGHGLVQADAALVRLRELTGAPAPVSAAEPGATATPAPTATTTPTPKPGSGGSGSTGGSGGSGGGTSGPSGSGDAPTGSTPVGGTTTPSGQTCPAVKSAERKLTAARKALKKARGKPSRTKARRLVAKRQAALRAARKRC